MNEMYSEYCEVMYVLRTLGLVLPWPYQSKYSRVIPSKFRDDESKPLRRCNANLDPCRQISFKLYATD